jgi:hypothetical protein
MISLACSEIVGSWSLQSALASSPSQNVVRRNHLVLFVEEVRATSSAIV